MTDALLPLALFMFVASITPGPNNIMLAAAGASAGFRATLPHMLGICAGLIVQIAVAGTGLGLLLAESPAAALVLRFGAGGYLVWLALSLLWPRHRTTTPSDAPVASGRPLSFLGAAAFQWVNPKAWMMALTVSGAMLPANQPFIAALALTGLTIAVVNLPCIACWAAAGAGIRRWLTSPARQRAFDATMGLLLLGTAGWIVAG